MYRTAEVLGRADARMRARLNLLRILTPLIKFRACRDNLRVATGAMEVRGGNGYIEEWIDPRLVRDAQIGLIWEGTSNIIALDAIGRAAAKMGAHKALGAALHARLARPRECRGSFARGLASRSIARSPSQGAHRARGREAPRMAAGGLYNAATAVLMAWEAGAWTKAGGCCFHGWSSSIVWARRIRSRR